MENIAERETRHREECTRRNGEYRRPEKERRHREAEGQSQTDTAARHQPDARGPFPVEFIAAGIPAIGETSRLLHARRQQSEEPRDRLEHTHPQCAERSLASAASHTRPIRLLLDVVEQAIVIFDSSRTTADLIDDPGRSGTISGKQRFNSTIGLLRCGQTEPIER